MSDEIKNPNTEEDQPDLMTLEDEDGNEITFEVIDALDHKGVHYLAAVEYAETEEEAENAQLVILSVGEDDEGEYLDVVDDDELVAVVERKGLEDLAGSLSGGRMIYRLEELATVPRAAVVVEERYSAIFKLTHVRPSLLAEALAECQVRVPSVPIIFAETRQLAQEWTYRFLGAALRDRRESQSATWS